MHELLSFFILLKFQVIIIFFKRTSLEVFSKLRPPECARIKIKVKIQKILKDFLKKTLFMFYFRRRIRTDHMK
jgi:hypothetical protein